MQGRPSLLEEGRMNVEMDYMMWGWVGDRKWQNPCSFVYFLCEVGARPVIYREGVRVGPRGGPGALAER